ncbi:PDC sensor domain-containing protein [Pseudothermotoga thermarum]|uniref:PDC sensor domain-containing protein n=1 Tax=Pseudothermotoga thermarum TaxID=119394 RepID=UPI00031C8089|nr:cache domain-containing protein [Pseudothermotoga thermarum]
MSIRGKMLAFLLAPIAALLCVAAVIGYFVANSNFEKIVTNLSQEIGVKGSDIVDRWFEGIIKEVKILAETAEVRNALLTGDWKSLMQEYLPPMLKTRPHFETFFIAYPDGTASTTAGAVINIANTQYFLDIFRNNKQYALSDPELSRVSQNVYVIVVSVPVRSFDGRLLGLFGATLPLDTIRQIASEVKFGQAGYGWIVDQSGLVIAHPNKDVVMNLNVLRSSAQGYKGLEEAGKKMLAGQTGYQKITTKDGVVEYTFYAPIKAAEGWSFIVSIPEREVLGLVIPVITSILILWNNRSSCCQRNTFVQQQHDETSSQPCNSCRAIW